MLGVDGDVELLAVVDVEFSDVLVVRRDRDDELQAHAHRGSSFP
jgi:hypothetical protein